MKDIITQAEVEAKYSLVSEGEVVFFKLMAAQLGEHNNIAIIRMLRSYFRYARDGDCSLKQAKEFTEKYILGEITT